MGLPALTVVVAENQLLSAEALSEQGVMHSLGRSSEVGIPIISDELRMLVASRGRRVAVSRAGRQLVDGLGAQRVAGQLENSIGEVN